MKYTSGNQCSDDEPLLISLGEIHSIISSISNARIKSDTTVSYVGHNQTYYWLMKYYGFVNYYRAREFKYNHEQ